MSQGTKEASGNLSKMELWDFGGWLIKNENHPLIEYLAKKNINLIASLAELSNDIKIVEKIKGGKSLIKRFKRDRSNFFSNWDEIKIASSLYEYFGEPSNMRIKKDSPDIELKINGTGIGIEIKSTLELQIEKIFNDLIFLYFYPKFTKNGFEVEITFLPFFKSILHKCEDLSTEDCCSFVNNRLNPSLLDFNENIKKGNLVGGTEYFNYALKPVNDIGSCKIRPYPVPENKIVDKIKEVKDKKQIPRNLPGIIIVSCHSLFFDWSCISEVKTYLDEQKQKGSLSNICAVFLFRYLFTIKGIGLGRYLMPFSDCPYWNNGIERLINTIKKEIKRYKKAR